MPPRVPSSICLCARHSHSIHFSHFPFTCASASCFSFFIFRLHAFRTLRSIFLPFFFFFGSYFRGGNDGRKGLLHYHIGSQAHAALLLRSRSESLVFGSATMNDVIAVDGLHATTVPLVSRSLPLRAPHRQCNISNNCKLN